MFSVSEVWSQFISILNVNTSTRAAYQTLLAGKPRAMAFYILKFEDPGAARQFCRSQIRARWLRQWRHLAEARSLGAPEPYYTDASAVTCVSCSRASV